MTTCLDRQRLLGGLSALALALFVRPAAAMPVFDAARLTEMITMLDRLTALYTNLQQGANQLQNASRRLPGSVRSLDDILLGVKTLTRDVNGISYRIETVTRQFKSVFPDDAAVKDTKTSELNTLSQNWDQEVHVASLTAARSQTTLSTLERNTQTAKGLLDQSAGEDSKVAQLQAMVRMIEVINSDLAQLATTLAATARVNSSLAATEASSAEVIAERRRRALKKYDRSSLDATEAASSESDPARRRELLRGLYTPPDDQGISEKFLKVD